MYLLSTYAGRSGEASIRRDALAHLAAKSSDRLSPQRNAPVCEETNLILGFTCLAFTPAAEQLVQHVDVGEAPLLGGSIDDCRVLNYQCHLSTPVLVLSCLSVGLMISFLLAWAFCIAFARAPHLDSLTLAAKAAAFHHFTRFVDEGQSLVQPK